MKDKRKELLDLLKKKSFNERWDPPFRLHSGATSPYYIDCKPTTNSARGMALIGELIFEKIKDLDVKAIGGLTMGADPIAHAVALTSFLHGKPINAFCVRKETKDHGIVKSIEGDVRPGDHVVIVDDVITTGESTTKAIRAATEFGLEIVKIIVLVDRQEQGGRERILKEAPKADFYSVFTLSEFAGRKAHEKACPKGSVCGESSEAYPSL